MKTIPKNEIVPRLSAAVLPGSSLLFLALTAPLLADDAAPIKDHALFAGATVQVEDGSGYFEIVGARGYSVSLMADGKLLHLGRSQIHKVNIERSLKLTDVIARVDKMVATPTYVGTNDDPFADLHMQVLLSDMSHDATSAVATANNVLAADAAQDALWGAHGGARSNPTPSELADSSAIGQAVAGATNLQSMEASFRPGAGHSSDNALDIACELSTPRAVHNTYLVVLTEFRAAGGGKSSYNVDVEPIGELGPTPRKVSLKQTGFPSHFVLGRVSLHLYAGSLELATNLSEGRVDLTAEDAMRYLVLAYVASHPKDSLSAAPLRIALPADFRQQADPADLSRTFYVTVGADGRVQELSADPDHPVAVHPYIDSAVRKFRYEPALKDGQAVASVVAMRLDTFLH